MPVPGVDVSYSIVPARSRDLASLPAIELAAARLLVGHAPESVLSETKPAFDLERACHDGRLWVALENDTPVGFAHVEVFGAGAAHLDELDVHPVHGRRGLGTRLVGAVCDWARREGFEAVTLSTFRDVPWNMPFYTRLGFTIVPPATLSSALAAVVADEARRGLDTDARVVMRRDLESRDAFEFIVRAAKPSDRPRMLDVWERSVRATHDFLSETDVLGLEPLVEAELEAGAIDWSVLAAAEAVVGFLGLAGNTIEALFLDPDHLRRGGGRMLVEHAQRLARGPLTVDVNAQNAAARLFYDALGFVVAGRSHTDSAGRPFPILHMKRAQ
jgi:putative acetyltransferase